jgi:hypothetical protein
MQWNDKDTNQWSVLKQKLEIGMGKHGLFDTPEVESGANEE